MTGKDESVKIVLFGDSITEMGGVKEIPTKIYGHTVSAIP